MSIDEPMKAKTVSRHGAYARIDHFCPNCMKMLYRKEQRCPNCGQAIKWNMVANVVKSAPTIVPAERMQEE